MVNSHQWLSHQTLVIRPSSIDAYVSHSHRHQVYNRKLGKLESRDHVWVAMSLERSKFEEDAFEKEMTLKQISKDPSDAQIREASNKVASFVS